MVEIDNNPLTAIARSDGAKSEAAGTTRTSGGCGERLGGPPPTRKKAAVRSAAPDTSHHRMLTRL